MLVSARVNGTISALVAGSVLLSHDCLILFFQNSGVSFKAAETARDADE